MLKNKVSRVIALVATVCCLGGAVTGLTVYAANAASSPAPASAAPTFTIEEPTGVRLKTSSSAFKTRWFSYYAGLTNSGGGAIEGDSPSPQGTPSEPFASITYQSKDADKTTYSVTLKEGTAEVAFYYTILENSPINSVTFSSEGANCEFAQEGTRCDLAFEGDSASCAITAVVTKPTYSLSFVSPTGAYFAQDSKGETRLRTASNVTAGSSYEFYLVAENESYSLENAKVYCGDNEVNLASESNSGTVEGTQREWKKYTLTVNASGTITAEGVKAKTFTVKYPGQQSGYTATGTTEVGWKGSATFTVTPDPGQRVKKVAYKMGENGETKEFQLSSGVNSYTISSITDNVTIEVEVEAEQYFITFPSDHPGYTITKDGEDGTELAGGVSVGYGPLKFKVTVNPGYDKTNLKVSFMPTQGNGSDLQLGEEGVYTLDVKSNGTINVSGITQITYEAQINNAVINYDVDGPNSTNYTYGQKFTFTVTAHDGYRNDGYTVTLKKAELKDGKWAKAAEGESISEITPSGPDVEQKSNTFTVTVKDNVIVLVDEKDNAALEHTVSLSASSEHVKIKVDGTDLGTANNDKVKHGQTFTFTVEAALGYSVTSVHVGTQALTLRDNGYTFTVNANSQIEVDTVENELTVNFLTVAGGNTDNKYPIKWSEAFISAGGGSSEDLYSDSLDANIDKIVKGIKDTVAEHPPVDNMKRTYLVPQWWTVGNNSVEFSEADITETAKSFAKGSLSITLQLHYNVNTEKVEELLRTFYAYYRDDDPNHLDLEKSYYIYRMELDSDAWKLFMDELNTVNGFLSAVGFTYSNAENVSNYGITDYTANDIAGFYGRMVAANDSGNGLVDCTKTGSNGANLWLFGYRWNVSGGGRENQVQFISKVPRSPSSTATRYFGGWFMFSIQGSQTVILGERTKTTNEYKDKEPPLKAPVQEALPAETPTMGDPTYEEGPSIG